MNGDVDPQPGNGCDLRDRSKDTCHSFGNFGHHLLDNICPNSEVNLNAMGYNNNGAKYKGENCNTFA